MNKILKYFAIIHLRWIQYQYKRISIKHLQNQTNQNIARLILLQAKEHYYKQCYSPWGKFQPQFWFTEEESQKHEKFMEWLFPKKDFEQWESVIIQHPEAVTYYQNKIFDLSQYRQLPDYKTEIINYLAEWA